MQFQLLWLWLCLLSAASALHRSRTTTSSRLSIVQGLSSLRGGAEDSSINLSGDDEEPDDGGDDGDDDDDDDDDEDDDDDDDESEEDEPVAEAEPELILGIEKAVLIRLVTMSALTLVMNTLLPKPSAVADRHLKKAAEEAEARKAQVATNASREQEEVAIASTQADNDLEIFEEGDDVDQQPETDEVAA